ncbi:MAG: DNA gyrase subunit B, partial [Gammaproteobacteria bacterium]|nr:DNA gyrase subunit B [Gammaproteobacteria bacterium]
FDKMLSSQEVGTLITALGCGIGREEFDPDKTRYHRIIIMTDADVDGAHIRTLLLTFFYRQVPELIERGYIYIAQPPLYKIKKGKQEQYLKDDEALEQYLTQLALTNSELYINKESPAISGQGLEKLVNDYRAVKQTIRRLSRLYPQQILDQLIYHEKLTADDLANESKVQAWTDKLAEILNTDNRSGAVRFELNLRKDNELDHYLPHIAMFHHGVESDYLLSTDFFNSQDYKKITSLGDELADLLQDGAYVQRGEKIQEVSSFRQALDWLMAEARRGQHIQRYKGLGEMNPDQLWETTMDPETRRMLQVTIEDAVGADQLFTTLMGDQVEPRRDFIESNALSVANLDV